MSYTVLARRYRSTTFDEVIGQNHIAQTLKRAIESGRIAHAFLFCGTRGTGKTSMARILAKALNCLSFPGPTATPCGTCAACQGVAHGGDMDYVEIDAASNTQVDKTREVIIDNVGFMPARCRFKVYLIDEVHMLSKGSFNALLKTLEEPPGHVKFILATTEAEKLPNTILSRCQRYDFRNIPTREVAGHLLSICKSEGISADEDALTLVARAGGGSMRDSLSLLDRVLSTGDKRLTLDSIEALLGLPRADQLAAVVDAVGSADAGAVLKLADEVLSSGMSPDALIAGLIDHLHNLLLLRVCGPASELAEIPGVARERLIEQSKKIDTTLLTQDITVLEDLRRQLRSGNGGRALMDATLVRLALAEQFRSLTDLLGEVEAAGANATAGGVGGAEEKKNAPDGAGRVTPAGGVAVAPVPRVAEAGPAVVEVAAVRVPTAVPAAQNGHVTEAAPTPVVSSSQADDDDALPAPGKVWDSSGPSLSEMLLGSSAAAKSQIPDPKSQIDSSPANIEPVSEASLPTVWRDVLEGFRKSVPQLYGMLDCTELGSIDSGTAAVHFNADRQSFAKMLEKKEDRRQLVASALSERLGKPVGLRFVINPETGPSTPPSLPAAAPARTAPPAPSPRSSAAPQGNAAAAPAPAASAVPAAPPATAVPLTDELLATFRQDPLLSAVMEKLGAQVLKVVEE